jgi:hypothetical protein
LETRGHPVIAWHLHAGPSEPSVATLMVCLLLVAFCVSSPMPIGTPISRHQTELALSAAQRVFEGLHGTYEDMVESIPGQESIHALFTCPLPACGSRYIVEAAEVGAGAPGPVLDREGFGEAREGFVDGSREGHEDRAVSCVGASSTSLQAGSSSAARETTMA